MSLARWLQVTPIGLGALTVAVVAMGQPIGPADPAPPASAVAPDVETAPGPAATTEVPTASPAPPLPEVAVGAAPTSRSDAPSPGSDGGGAMAPSTTTPVAVNSPTAPAAPADAREAEATSVGLSLGVGVSSLYYFRGLNVFQSEQQSNIHALLELSAAYAIGETGLSFGYWGAYQLNGANRAEMVDAGIGHEQDLIVRFEREAVEGLTLGGGLTYYVFPFADKDAAGAIAPSYLEPAVWLAYSTVLDLGLNVAYFAGLQNALEDYRYLYLNPFVGKQFDLSTAVDIAFAVGAGFKIYNYPSRMVDNRFDVRFDWTTPIDAGSGVSITPGAHLGWTDLEDLGVGDEYTAWLSLSTALSI